MSLFPHTFLTKSCLFKQLLFYTDQHRPHRPLDEPLPRRWQPFDIGLDERMPEVARTDQGGAGGHQAAGGVGIPAGENKLKFEITRLIFLNIHVC